MVLCHVLFFLSGGGNGNPLPYSCLKNSTDRGAWRAEVQGIAKSWTGLSAFFLGLILLDYFLLLFRWPLCRYSESFIFGFMCLCYSVLFPEDHIHYDWFTYAKMTTILWLPVWFLPCISIRHTQLLCIWWSVTHSCPTLSNPMDCSLPAPLPMGFSMQEYWSRLPLASPTLQLILLTEYTTEIWFCLQSLKVEVVSPSSEFL